MYTLGQFDLIKFSDNVESYLFVGANICGLSKFCWFDPAMHEDVISWVTGLLHYNAKQFITLLNVHEYVNSWERVPNKINKH